MKKIKSKKGVTLITVGIAIIIMLILLTTLVYRSTKNTQLQKLDNLYNDIQLLNEKVALYYYKHGALPVAGTYTGDLPPTETLNPNDNGVYYIIDITALENVTLSNNPNIEDNIYIINERSQTIYFPKGVTIDGEAYYRLPELFAKIMTAEEIEEEERRNNFIFVMNIPDNDRTYGLNTRWGTVNLTIDWGDGQTSIVTAVGDGNNVHTYESAGIYTIKVSGVASGSFSFYNEQRLISIISGFPENMCPNATNLGDIFRECMNLTGSIPGDMFANCPNVTSFSYAFAGCKITSIPENLFVNCTKATDFRYIFAGCVNIIGNIPENLFANCTSAVNFMYTFASCGNITGSIPENLFTNCPNVTNFMNTFGKCSNLSGSIPEGLFANCPNVTDFNNVFRECINLTGSIPEGLFANCTNVIDFGYAFYSCYNLTGSIPGGLFANCPNVTKFDLTFYNCANLTGSIPGGLFDNCPNVTTFSWTFASNSGLTGPAPELWNRANVTEPWGCFIGCFGLSNYASIPNDWK